jgi:hypothetical protein
MLQETAYSEVPLYAKIGCMERETYTSTKLALHVYTDSQCSKLYDDGHTARRHATKGFTVNGYTFPTRVSFKPPFYTCDNCTPETISETFNKKSGTWYDDDYINQYGTKKSNSNNDGIDQDGDEQDAYSTDDKSDDAYLAANDDIYGNDDGNNQKQYSNNNGGNYYYYYNKNGDDYYKGDDDRRRGLLGGDEQAPVQDEDSSRLLQAAEGQLEVCHKPPSELYSSARVILPLTLPPTLFPPSMKGL